MTTGSPLSAEVRDTISAALHRRVKYGNVSTARVMKEVRESFPDRLFDEQSLERTIAEAAVRIGLQVELSRP